MSTSLFPVHAKTNSHPLPEHVFIRGNYRFTLITDGILRVEFDPLHRYIDEPTQAIWFRNTGKVDFTVSDRPYFSLATKRFSLMLIDDQTLSETALTVTCFATKTSWHYGDTNETMPGTARTLDGADGKTPLGTSVLSRSGIAILDDHDSLILDAHLWPMHRPTSVDFYVFAYGHDYLEAVKGYYAISGDTPLIPRYILGNWWSKYWAYKDTDLLAIADRFASEHIPLSVMIVDMDWHITAIPGIQDYWAGWTGYTVNTNLFPDYPGFISKIHQRGLRTSVNLHPAGGVKSYEKQYQAFCEAVGADASTKETIPFDSADPLHMKAYFDVLLHPYENQGVDFWWIDWQQGNRSKTEGLDPLWMLNHLHFYDSARDPKKRPFTFSRWSGKGAQRYPIGFSGDTHITWDSLAYQPYFTAMASNIGFGHWSHDIGGHMSGIEDPELYTRWVQFGCFSPILRLHSCSNPYAVREPWRYEAPYRTIISDFMRLRGQLIPYLYTAAHRNASKRIPLILPLYFHHPEIESCYEQDNTYYFGSELLVHPVTKPIEQETRRVIEPIYLPPGKWMHFSSNLLLGGDSTYQLPFALEDIGLFAKPGAILPLDGSACANGAPAPTHFIIHVFPGEGNIYTLYEDDGQSTDYLRGHYYETVFTYSEHQGRISFRILPSHIVPDYIPSTRSYEVIFHSIRGEHAFGYIDELGTHVKIDASLTNQAHTIVLQDYAQAKPCEAVQRMVDRYLVSLTLPHGVKTAIAEAFKKSIQKAPIQRTYKDLSLAHRRVLDSYLKLLLPPQK